MYLEKEFYGARVEEASRTDYSSERTTNERKARHEPTAERDSGSYCTKREYRGKRVHGRRESAEIERVHNGTIYFSLSLSYRQHIRRPRLLGSGQKDESSCLHEQLEVRPDRCWI